jgi:cytidylate kinase
LHFEFNPESQLAEIFLNNENVEYVIRDMVVAEKVSEVAAIASVRTFAVQQQKYMGEKKGIVMDGRDIGTTVFPEAELKIFMTADMLIRVERRFLEMQIKNPNITFKEVQSNLQMRDQIDSTREVSPLKMATDAILLDNSELTMEQQLEISMQLIQEKL